MSGSDPGLPAVRRNPRNMKADDAQNGIDAITQIIPGPRPYQPAIGYAPGFRCRPNVGEFFSGIAFENLGAGIALDQNLAVLAVNHGAIHPSGDDGMPIPM